MKPFEPLDEERSEIHLRTNRIFLSIDPLLRNLAPSLLILAVAGLWLLAPGAARAQSREQIDFDFRSESAFTLLGGTIVTPPDGTLDLGSATVSVAASAPGTFVPGGRFALDDLTIAGTVSKNVFGAAQIDGTYSASQTRSLVGTLSPGMAGGDFVDDLAVDLNIVLGCVGSGCSSLGFPLSDIGPALLSVSFLSVSNLGLPGNARITASIPFEVGGVLGFFDLVGVESARTFVVPEPGTIVLVAGGLAILAIRRGHSRFSPND